MAGSTSRTMIEGHDAPVARETSTNPEDSTARAAASRYFADIGSETSTAIAATAVMLPPVAARTANRITIEGMTSSVSVNHRNTGRHLGSAAAARPTARPAAVDAMAAMTGGMTSAALPMSMRASKSRPSRSVPSG